MNDMNCENKNTMQNILREFIFIIFYRKNLILLIFFSMLLATVALFLFLPSIYRSSATFIVSLPQQLDPLRQEISYDSKNRLVRFISDQREVIYSNRVLKKVAEIVYPNMDAKDYDAILEKLRKNTSVIPPKGESFEATNAFYIHYQDKTPEITQKIAALITDIYMEEYADIARSKSEYSYQFLKEQAESLYQDMVIKGEASREFEAMNALALIDILNLESGKTNIESGPKELLTGAQRTRQDLLENHVASISLVEEMEALLSPNNMPVILPEMEGSGRAVTTYKNKIVQLQMQLNEMKTQFTDEYIPIRQIEQELQKNIALLHGEVSLILQAKGIEAKTLHSRIREIDATIAGLEQTIRDTAVLKTVYQKIKQEHELATHIYSETMIKLEQARMAKSLNEEKQNIVLVDRPELHLKPYKPNRILLLVLGILAALLLSIAAALTFDFFDHSIKTPEDIKRYLKTPVMGSVPPIRQL